MLTESGVEVLGRLPWKLELVGGPFCGVTLFTRRNLVSDVYAELMNSKARGAGIDTWVPISGNEIHITRVPMAPGLAPEVCIYRPQKGARWLYSGLQVDDSPVKL